MDFIDADSAPLYWNFVSWCDLVMTQICFVFHVWIFHGIEWLFYILQGNHMLEIHWLSNYAMITTPHILTFLHHEHNKEFNLDDLLYGNDACIS